jgi:hypothetical protein
MDHRQVVNDSALDGRTGKPDHIQDKHRYVALKGFAQAFVDLLTSFGKLVANRKLWPLRFRPGGETEGFFTVGNLTWAAAPSLAVE